MKAIISGGGTGGHIFPAIAIANALVRRHPDADILFVGAEGRMEMEKVPAAGFRIEALPIAGLQRRLALSNLLVPFKMLKSQHKVRRILREFCPDIVVGVGGYASAPTLRTAASMGFPTLLQEQNSYPGLTNKMLAAKAEKICVAYEGMDHFFPVEKLVMTGNPVRADIENISVTRDEGRAFFGLEGERPVVFSVGGSLGAGSINLMILNNINFFVEQRIRLIWQTGRSMYDEAVSAVKSQGAEEWIAVQQFVSRMDMAYAAADLIVSRAGAIAISELCLVGKPVVLIPSPNVAEDHQTKNAMALASRGAALVVKDAECNVAGIDAIRRLLSDEASCKQMSHAILAMGKRGAADRIVDEIDQLLDKRTSGK